MQRLQIQLDERLYDALVGSFKTARPPDHTLEGFGFIGAGSREPPGGGPVSVRHDEFLDKAIAARFPRP